MEDGLEIVEELVETTSNSELKNRLQLFRISVLMATGGEQLVDVFGQVAKANQSNPNLLNELAWGIVEVADSGREVEPELVQAARQAIDWAVEKEPRNAAILDTQAHIAYLQGNLDEAIEIQTKAVENAEPEIRDELAEFLKSLQKEQGDEDDTDDGDTDDGGTDEDDRF